MLENLFQGTHAYFGALNVASMIPFSRLFGVTTVAGACKTMLFNLTLDSPANEYRSFINALCRWNRAGDIIELAMERIDEAFRSQALNESAVSVFIVFGIFPIFFLHLFLLHKLLHFNLWQEWKFNSLIFNKCNHCLLN